jgi:chemotaxis protein methyltransferase CheR
VSRASSTVIGSASSFLGSGSASASRRIASIVSSSSTASAPTRRIDAHPARAGETEADDALSRAYADRDYPRAAEIATRLVEDDGGVPATWAVLIRSLANQGLLEDAGKACAAALDRHRTSAELAYLHTVLLAAAGRHSEAVSAARRALYLDHRMIVAHIALATACTRVGDHPGARRAFRNAQRLLHAMPPGDPVPASDGERAGRLLATTRLLVRMLEEAAA